MAKAYPPKAVVFGGQLNLIEPELLSQVRAVFVGRGQPGLSLRYMGRQVLREWVAAQAKK